MKKYRIIACVKYSIINGCAIIVFHKNSNFFSYTNIYEFKITNIDHYRLDGSFDVAGSEGDCFSSKSKGRKAFFLLLAFYVPVTSYSEYGI